MHLTVKRESQQRQVFPPIQTDEIVEVGIGQISVTVNN